MYDEPLERTYRTRIADLPERERDLSPQPRRIQDLGLVQEAQQTLHVTSQFKFVDLARTNVPKRSRVWIRHSPPNFDPFLTASIRSSR